MLRTYIDDDAAGSGEVHSLHEFIAFRTADVADFFAFAFGQWHADGGTEDAALLFAIGADLFEGKFVSPNAFAGSAFVQHHFADVDARKRRVGFAARAIEDSRLANFAIGAGAAEWTKTRAVENHAEAGRAGDGGEAGATMAAIGRVAAGGRAAH